MSNKKTSSKIKSVTSIQSTISSRRGLDHNFDQIILKVFSLYIPEGDPPCYALKVSFFDQLLISAIVQPIGIADKDVLQTDKIIAKGCLNYDPSDYEKMCLFADTPLIVNIQRLKKGVHPRNFDMNASQGYLSSFFQSQPGSPSPMSPSAAKGTGQRGRGNIMDSPQPPTQQVPIRSPEAIKDISCCNIDILPLFLDQESICVKKRMQPMRTPKLREKKSWDNLPLLMMSVTAERHDSNESHHRFLQNANWMKITVIGAYNLLTPFNSDCYYTAASKLPMYNDAGTEMMLYSEGFPASRKFNNMRLYPRWETLRLQGEPFAKSDDKTQFNYDDIHNPDDIDLPYYLKRASEQYNTVWGSFHRSLLLGKPDKLWDHICKWYWPIEVHYYGDQTGGFSFMGFMDLFQLLYPGVRKLTLAVPLQWFNWELMEEKCNCNVLLMPNDKTAGTTTSQAKSKKDKGTDSIQTSSASDDDAMLRGTGGDGQTAFVLVEVQFCHPLVPESIPPFITRTELRKILAELEPHKGSRVCKGRGQLATVDWRHTLNMAVKSLQRTPHHGLTDICIFSRRLSETRTRVEIFTSFWMEAALYVNNNFVVTQYLHSDEAFEELLKIAHVCMMNTVVDTLIGDEFMKIDPTLRAARHARHVHDTKHAMELYLQTVVQSPSDSGCWRELSTCLKDVDTNWAAVCVNKALLLDIRNPLTILSKSCMVLEKDLDAAEPFITSLLLLYPFWPTAYVVSAAYFTMREHFKLADALKESLALIQAEGLTTELYLPRAWERELGDFWESPTILPGMSPFYSAADLLLRIRGIRLAEVCLGIALAENGETAVYFHLVAMCCRLKGDYENAICLMDMGLDKFGNNPALQFLKGESYHLMGDVNAATAAFKEAKGYGGVYGTVISLSCWEPPVVRSMLVDLQRRHPSAYGWMAIANDWLLRAELDKDIGSGDPQRSFDTNAPAYKCAAACAVQALKYDRRAGRAWAMLAKLVKPRRRREHCINMATECGFQWSEEISVHDLRTQTQESACHLLDEALIECHCDMCQPLHF